MEKLLPISEAAQYLGVSPKTLRRWEKKGRISPFRTKGNQRRYSIDHLNSLKEANPSQNSSKTKKPQLSTSEAAKRLGVAPRTLRRWENEGESPTYLRTSGGHRRYSPQELKRFQLEAKEQNHNEKNNGKPKESQPPGKPPFLPVRSPQDFQHQPNFLARSLLVTSLTLLVLLSAGWITTSETTKERIKRSFNPEIQNPIVDVNDAIEYQFAGEEITGIKAKFPLETDSLITRTLRVVNDAVFNTTHFLGTLFFGQSNDYYITPKGSASFNHITSSSLEVENLSVLGRGVISTVNNTPAGTSGNLTLEEGQNITITEDKTGGKITISSSGGGGEAQGGDADTLEGKPGGFYLSWPNFTSTPTILSSLNNVSNNEGNIDLVGGSNITITADDVANTITISASGGFSGDADTLDTLDSTEFLRSNASDSFTSGTLTFSGGTILDISSAGLTLAPNQVGWDRVSKTGSSLADLATRSASDLSSGNLNIARLPTGGNWNITSNLSLETDTLFVGADGGSYEGKVGIGTATPQAKTEVVSTAEQLRLSYDATRYTSLTTDITGGGDFSITPSGSRTSINSELDVASYAAIGNSAGTPIQTYILITKDNTANISGTNYGVYSEISGANAASDSSVDLYGVLGISQVGLPAVNYSGTLYGVSGQVKHLGTTTLSNAVALDALVDNNTTGTIETAKSLNVKNPLNSGTITTNYGIYIEGQTSGATNYSLYTNAGDISLGDNLDFRQAATISTSTGNLTIDSGGTLVINDSLDLSNAAKTVTLANVSDALNFDSNTLSIDAGSNRIGIGTAGPTEKLEVSGNIKLTNINDQLAFADDGYIKSSANNTIELQSGGTTNFKIADRVPYVIQYTDTFNYSNLHLQKTGLADATTQYPSYDLTLQGSGWDTSLSAATDLTGSLRLITGSGPTGAIPYRIGILDDTPEEWAVFDLLNQRLGIGTNPTERLHVLRPDSSIIAVSSRADNDDVANQFCDGTHTCSYIGADFANNGNLFLGTDYTNKDDFVVTTSGDVGVGTNSPSTKFEVSGAAKATTLIAQRNSLHLGNPVLLNRFEGHPISDTGDHPTTESGGIIYSKEHAAFGKAVQLAEATTNLWPEPSGEVTPNTSGSLNLSGTWASSSDYAKYGSKSFKIDDTAYRYMILTRSVTVGETYIVQFWRRTSADYSAAGGAGLAVETGGGAAVTNTVLYGTRLKTTAHTEWELVIVKVEVTASGSVNFLFANTYGGTCTGQVYFDGIDIQEKAYPTPYADGSLGAGHSWSGTAHASTSSRTETDLKYSASLPDQFTISVKLTPFMRPSENPNTGFNASGFMTWRAQSDDDNRIDLYYEPSIDAVRMRWRGNGINQDIDDNLDLNRFQTYEYTLTSDGSTAYLYRDGVEVGSISSPNQFTTTPSELFIGSSSIPGPINGWVDEFMVLDEALTPDEITASNTAKAPSSYNSGEVNVLGPDVLRVDASGNVGIGTRSPNAELHLSAVDADLTIQSTGSNNTELQMFDSSGNGWVFFNNEGNSDRLDIAQTLGGAWNATHMSIKSSGEVGIGTIDPLTALDISNSNVFDTSVNITGQDNIHLRSGGSGGEGTFGATISFSKADGTVGKRHAAITTVQSTVDPDSLGFAFYTHTNTAADPMTESFKIASHGDVTGVYGNYHVSSDRSLKKEITTIDNALEKALSLRGVNFRWKDENFDNGELQMGLIAQEVEEVVPEVVHETESGLKAVEYPFLAGLFTEAIKDLNQKVEDLQAQVDAQGDLSQTSANGSTTKITTQIVEAEEGIFKHLTATAEAVFESIKAKTAQIASAVIDSLTVKTIAVKGDATGQATIKAGEKRATIASTVVEEESRIFTSPVTPTGGQVLIIGEKVSGESFEVYIEKPQEEDITFDWWIVNKAE